MVSEPFNPEIVPPTVYVGVTGVGAGVGAGAALFVPELPPPHAVNRDERPANIIAKSTFFI